MVHSHSGSFESPGKLLKNRYIDFISKYSELTDLGQRLLNFLGLDLPVDPSVNNGVSIMFS